MFFYCVFLFSFTEFVWPCPIDIIPYNVWPQVEGEEKEVKEEKATED